MKNLKTLLLFFLTLFLLNLSCSKDDSIDTKSEQTLEEELLEIYTLQYELTNQFLDTKNDYDDEIAHQDAVLEWIRQRPDVAEVEMYDFTYYTIKHTNGINTVVSFIKETEDHASATRGAGSFDGTLMEYSANALNNENKIITNKNVLVLCPFVNFMYDGDKTVKGRRKKITEIKEQFAEANADFNVTYKINDAADVQAFSDLEDYGFIIMATHGSITGVSVAGTFVVDEAKDMTTPNKVNFSPIDEKKKALIKSGYLNPVARVEYSIDGTSKMSFGTEYELTFPYFATLGLKMDDSILYGAFCYSGYKGGLLGKALAKQGLKTYYGFGYAETESEFSRPISNVASWDAEKILIDNLTKDFDSTGVAHLIDNVKPLTDDDFWRRTAGKNRLERLFGVTGPQPLSQWLAKDYYYENCKNDEESIFKASIDIVGNDTRQFEVKYTNIRPNADGEGSLAISVRTEADGTNTSASVDLRTYEFKGVGTYPIGKASRSNEGWDALIVFNETAHWNSFDPPSGSITFTDVCETYVKGTFSFSARLSGSTRTLQVNNGEFVANF